jgi:hypothetical protein
MRRGDAFLHIATLAALLLVPAMICFTRNVVTDPDVWWHLRAGQWILQHRAWPTTDTFSSFAHGRPWIAYSWTAELILLGLYQTLGLRGLVLYTALLAVAIVAAFHGLVRRLGTNALLAIVLTLAAAFALGPLARPRPWLFSILLFVVELDLLLSASRKQSPRLLLWLVPLFALWANMHIQFVVGLAVMGLAVAESVMVGIVPIPIADDESRRMPAGWMLLILTLCVAATLLNPYHYHLYEVAVQLAGQTGLWNVIEELKAMSFRSTSHWIVLGVTVTAAFALGWRRRTRLLLAALFALALYVSFRSRREVWLVLLTGLAVLADTARASRGARDEGRGAGDEAAGAGDRELGAGDQGPGARGALALAPNSESPVLSPQPSARNAPGPGAKHPDLSPEFPGSSRAPLNWAVAGVVVLSVTGGVLLLSQSRLEQKVADGFPAEAVRFIGRLPAGVPGASESGQGQASCSWHPSSVLKGHDRGCGPLPNNVCDDECGPLPSTKGCLGPMFNPFGWGGYLIFHLPQVPVSMDGRTMVHGEERIVRHADTLLGRGDWKNDPELTQARLVILPRKGPLATLLATDPRFRLVYEDQVAAVFTGAGAEPSQSANSGSGSQ